MTCCIINKNTYIFRRGNSSFLDKGEIVNKWNKCKYRQWQKELLKWQDSKYRKFQQRLINTKYPILGIRVNQLRKMAKNIALGDIYGYLRYCQDDSYEEVLLQGLVIATIRETECSFKYFDKFIRKIDNWAICDTCCASMKIVHDHLDYYLPFIKDYLKDSNPFVVRIGIVLFLDYYLPDKKYVPLIFSLCDEIQTTDYYVNMAIAWLLSICYIKHKELTTAYLNNNKLSSFVYRKTIQKILESRQVSDLDKKYWKIKRNLDYS